MHIITFTYMYFIDHHSSLYYPLKCYELTQKEKKRETIEIQQITDKYPQESLDISTNMFLFRMTFCTSSSIFSFA